MKILRKFQDASGRRDKKSRHGHSFDRCVTAWDMFGLSLGHLLIIGVVALLFGYRRLPELGSALGSGLSAFKKGLEGKDQDGKSIDNKNNDRKA